MCAGAPVGLGLDAVDVERFRRVLARRPGVAERCFTEAERNSMARRSDPVPGLAARFAAKEATMKALGVGLGGLRLAEVEILSEASGAPVLHLSGEAAALAARLGVTRWQVSLTHTAALAGAIVLAT
ncbi:MAG: holo-(acyl-carrier-protein) synthase [Acidimicrobiaceae bacterium]|nr:holo-(acyl-carrier-protein) synthase [Acidimicrobiaceae bacterium]